MKIIKKLFAVALLNLFFLNVFAAQSVRMAENPNAVYVAPSTAIAKGKAPGMQV